METFWTDWWPVIVPAMLAIAKVLNKITKHWPQWHPYLRWFGFLVELLDIVRIPEIRKNDTKTQR